MNAVAQLNAPDNVAADSKLQDSQRMESLGRLVGGVAHDFNNLLTGIMLYCDLLIAGLDGNPRLRHHAEEIRKAGANSAALIQQLLAVTRRQAVEPRPLLWNQVVSGMGDLLAKLIGEDIELGLGLASDLNGISLDRTQAQQIVLNLVLNARDAMPDGGRIMLQTRNRAADLTNAGRPRRGLKSVVEFAVTDTGSGMDAETRSHLFEPFFTRKDPGRGTGLGLATVHSIATKAGGTIEVQSEPGRGTRVSVFLPAIEAPASAPAQKSQHKNKRER